VDEIGFDMAQYGARRVLILTDSRVNELGVPARIADSLARHGISSEIFDGCHVEPTDDSMDKAAGYAREQGPWDGFVAVGGGSSIDTAKAVNLLTTATFAGMGFGNAGVHIPHADGYPIAGMVKDCRPQGYPQQEPMVPHGQSVSLTEPEAFRFTFPSAPERHLRCAAMLAPGRDTPSNPAQQLPSALIGLMRDIGIPNGIGAVGYVEADIPDLVPGTMKQQRLLATCARPVTEEDIAGIFARSIQNW
jgi:alcohol dehydrogenase class IV